MKKSKVEPSRTNWERVRRQAAAHQPIACEPADELYDPSDDAAVENAWARSTITDAQGRVIRRGRGPQKAPTKERITIRLSSEVVQRFRADGPGWQTQIDAVLQEWVSRHPEKRK